MRTFLMRQNRRSGFTILELMIVMFIIIVLVSILVPVISGVRRAGYIAATQQEMSSISNAIQQYYTTFNAYPGPIDDGGNNLNSTGSPPLLTDSIDGQFPPPPGYVSPSPGPTNQYRLKLEVAGLNSSATPATWTYLPATNWMGNVTSSENLVLALLGGLRMDRTTNPGPPIVPQVAFAPDEVGLGPLNLNPNSTQRYTPFITATNLSSLLGDWKSPGAARLATAGQLTAANVFQIQSYYTVENTRALADGSETIIPEFLDQFPTRMPILYLRARVGAAGIISDGTINTANIDPTITSPQTPALYQYDLRGIQGYTVGWQNGPLNQQGAKLQGLLGVGAFHSPNTASPNNLPPQITVPGKPTIPANGGQNAADYFTNPTIAPSDPADGTNTQANYNHSGTPRSKDTYILISPGPDGVYGTPDDITSFGAVSP